MKLRLFTIHVASEQK